MDEVTRDFLSELCAILRDIDEELHLIATGCESMACVYPNERDQQQLQLLLADSERCRLVFRLARHAATATAFHMLVLMDERREVGQAAARPRLVLDIGGKEISPPPNLHELLGATMQDLGMDTDEWW